MKRAERAGRQMVPKKLKTEWIKIRLGGRALCCEKEA